MPMPTLRIRRVLVFAATGSLAMLLLSSPVWGAHLGRKIDWLQVRQVEISGARLLAAAEVLEASGIREGQHLLDERERWEAALREHPVIAEAAITRRFPHTLRIRVVEESPVALLADGTLRFATAAGAVLPVDAHTVALDLPVVHASMKDSVAVERARRTLVETDRLTRLAPELLREVSEIRMLSSGGEALVLAHRAAEIILPFGASAVRLAELGSVLAELERRGVAPGQGPRPRRYQVDLRFAEQVVVRPASSRELS
jgi:cell division septal protein FtsQ